MNAAPNLARMSDQELAGLMASLHGRLAGDAWVPHEPTDKQAEFLALDGLEALYGGAAGGGKSDALLMAAAQFVHVPGYSALLLRRTFQDLNLPGAIMDRAKDWWLAKPGVRWSEKDKRFTFPSGATIAFGYIDNERDRFRYQSAEFQFIGWDELTQFPEGWYRYLLSRLRRLAGSDVPLRMRSASNPGGLGHDWVRRRFVEEGAKQAFVPATLEDNSHLDAEAYRGALAQLDPTTRAQLLQGLWVRDSGGLVYQYDSARNDAVAAPELTQFVLGIDYGYTDATAFAVLGWAPHDRATYVVRTLKRTGLTPSDAAEQARALAKDYAFDRIVADIGGLGKGYAEEARQRFGLPIEPAEKKNKRGYQDLLNGDLRAGRLKVLPGNQALLDEWQELPWDEQRKEEAAGFDNHMADAVLYGWRACLAFLEEPVKEPLPTGSQAWEEAAREKRRQTAETRGTSPWWARRGR